MTTRRLVIGLAAAFCGTGGEVFADGFRNPPDTAAALGKANNHMVWVDDASAVFYNPANLTDLTARQVQLSTLVGHSSAEFSGPLGTTETESPWSLLPAFALAWPLPQEDLAFGLGLHVPYGRHTRWDSSELFRYRAPVFTEMSVTDLSPALAWRVSDAVSVGAGLDLYYGRLRFRQLLGPFGPPFPPDGRVEAEADGYAVGGNVGITWNMTENQRLALTCRSPFDLKFDGDLRTTDMLLPPLMPPTAAESDLETTFKFPTIVALGYGIRLTDTVRVETKVEWLEYSRNRTMKVDGGANALLVQGLGLSNSPQNWEDTWTFGIGPEWRFARDWTLRAGYLYLQSPIPDSTFAPGALDVDQSLVSVGLGYERERHAVDLAYALGLFETRRVRANQNPAYIGDYEFQGHLAALTYTYSF